MSMMGAPFAPGSAETGETIASFTSYEKAQQAVSRLIASEVPAREIAIVGAGLRSVERITGRLGYAAAARSGAVNGLVLGVMFAAILVLGSSTVPIQAVVGVLFLGIAVGMLLSILMFALVRRRRDYASVVQISADHYEVRVAPGNVRRARDALGVTPPRPAPPAASDAPPQYGERVAPPAHPEQPRPDGES